MTNDELNQYILHYLKEDRTNSAIMLTAGWGTGKSYYIQNELIPFLGKEENGGYPCIVVSLYGLKSIEEISKSLYFESRMKFLSRNSEGIATGKLAVKTVVKGITSFFGVDLSKTEEELQELYQSVDLSGKLIILEDIERTGINILDVLGYINNLVEQDGVKVLLVANEDEVMKYHNSEPDKNGRTRKIPDKDTVTYLKIKEKTVSDTILYNGDVNSAISNIILSFGNEVLSKFAAENQVKNVIEIMVSLKNFNLRSFLFACQKVSDIYNILGTIKDVVARTIFFSVLSFSMQIKDGPFPKWDGTDTLSTKLGFRDFPLYRFCYDYIRWQKFDKDNVQEAFDAHKKLRLYNQNIQSIHDADLRIIFNYYVHSEKEVLNALKEVERRLDDSEDIPIYCYSELAYALISCRTILGFDYTFCKEKMIFNIQQHRKEIDSDVLFLDRFEFENENEKQQFTVFSQALQDAAKVSTRTLLDFSYKPKDIHSFYLYVAQNTKQVTAGHAFISKFELDKLVDMIFTCNPNQLYDWQRVLDEVYGLSIKANFLETDHLFMEELKHKINNKLSERRNGMDRIVLFQINLLVKNLQTFIEQQFG